MSANVSSPSTSDTPVKDKLETQSLTEAQIEFLDDLRISLTQMKQGKVQPARKAICEIRLELEAEDDGNSPDG